LGAGCTGSARVTEANEGSNRYRFAVTVSGECCTAPPARLPEPAFAPDADG
jgi:hypothetical protein